MNSSGKSNMGRAVAQDQDDEEVSSHRRQSTHRAKRRVILSDDENSEERPVPGRQSTPSHWSPTPPQVRVERREAMFSHRAPTPLIAPPPPIAPPQVAVEITAPYGVPQYINGVKYIRYQAKMPSRKLRQRVREMNEANNRINDHDSTKAGKGKEASRDHVKNNKGNAPIARDASHEEEAKYKKRDRRVVEVRNEISKDIPFVKEKHPAGPSRKPKASSSKFTRLGNEETESSEDIPLAKVVRRPPVKKLSVEIGPIATTPEAPAMADERDKYASLMEGLTDTSDDLPAWPGPSKAPSAQVEEVKKVAQGPRFREIIDLTRSDDSPPRVRMLGGFEKRAEPMRKGKGKAAEKGKGKKKVEHDPKQTTLRFRNASPGPSNLNITYELFDSNSE